MKLSSKIIKSKKDMLMEKIYYFQTTYIVYYAVKL